MTVLMAFIDFAFRSFEHTVGNLLAVLVFVALIVVLPAWTVPLLVVGLVIALALLNGRAFRQLYYEAHGSKAFEEGRHAEAEACFRNSWALAQSLRKNDPARSRLLEWLSTVTHAQGKHEDAEAFAREWLANDEKTLGSDHLRTVSAMQNLGEILCTTARHQEALPLLEKALSVREKWQRTDPVEYAMCLQWLGAVWHHLHEPEKAEAFLARASAILGQPAKTNPA